MVNLDNIIGDIVFISFVNIERLVDIGIKEPSGHFLLTGYDQMGLWLKHPGITIIYTEDKSGKPISISKQTKEEIAADFIVTWDNVNTVMHYPERKGFDFPSEFNKIFGFRFKNAKTNMEK